MIFKKRFSYQWTYRGLVLALLAAGSASAQESAGLEKTDLDLAQEQLNKMRLPQITKDQERGLERIMSEVPTDSKALKTPSSVAVDVGKIPGGDVKEPQSKKASEQKVVASSEKASEQKAASSSEKTSEQKAVASSSEKASEQKAVASSSEKASEQKAVSSSADSQEMVPSSDNEIGQFQESNVPMIIRYDDDGDGDRPKLDVQTRAGGLFFRGEPIRDDAGSRVKYVYLSRGAWIIKAFQPYIDKLAPEVLRADRTDVTANFIEVTRSMTHLATLIASDDGSDQMLTAIARSLADHRQQISLLKLNWKNAPANVEALIKDYINKTFLQELTPEQKTIQAGSQADLLYERMDVPRYTSRPNVKK